MKDYIEQYRFDTNINRTMMRRVSPLESPAHRENIQHKRDAPIAACGRNPSIHSTAVWLW